jgi:hypothetical protein
MAGCPPDDADPQKFFKPHPKHFAHNGIGITIAERSWLNSSETANQINFMHYFPGLVFEAEICCVFGHRSLDLIGYSTGEISGNF